MIHGLYSTLGYVSKIIKKSNDKRKVFGCLVKQSPFLS